MCLLQHHQRNTIGPDQVTKVILHHSSPQPPAILTSNIQSEFVRVKEWMWPSPEGWLIENCMIIEYPLLRYKRHRWYHHSIREILYNLSCLGYLLCYNLQEARHSHEKWWISGAVSQVLNWIRHMLFSNPVLNWIRRILFITPSIVWVLAL